MDRYGAYAFYLKMKRLNDLESQGSAHSIAQEKKDEIQNKGKKVKGKYKFKSKWYPELFKTFWDICKEVGEEASYKSSYAYLSDFVHFNVFSLFKHDFEESGHEKILITKQSSGKEHLGFSLELVLRIYQQINDEFDLGLNNSLEDENKKMHSFEW